MRREWIEIAVAHELGHYLLGVSLHAEGVD